MIFWLASYPKSGNTWLRVFLANLLNEKAALVDINSISLVKNFDSRQVFDAWLGWESSELEPDTIDRARCAIQDLMGREDRHFFKVHDAFLHPVTEARLFSASASTGVVYIIRNPLDVATSFANHLGRTIDDAIAMMNSADAVLRMNSQLPQPMGDWSWHVRSWTEQSVIPVHIMRYEDMLDRPREVFSAASDFLGLSPDRATFDRALANSNFEVLQNQEQLMGFKEASPNRIFFRKGRKGDWRVTLSPSQIESIIGRHGQVMKRFGYLEAESPRSS